MNGGCKHGETVLELRNLSKVFSSGTFRKRYNYAVNEVSFALKRGSIVSLIGESGSGKTTAGKMILKLLRPTSGQILFGGRNIAGITGRRERREYYRRVQGVFQEPFASFNPLFKVDRVFDMVRSVFYPGQRNWKREVEEALRSVNLEAGEVLGKFPHQLSGGQLQRLLIARALLMQSEVLVADELISMLDASTRIGVLNLLGKLAYDRGLAVIFITHDLSLGYYISDESLIMYNGRLVEVGATEKVYEQPTHPYTKLLMKSVPDISFRWDMEEEFDPGEISRTVEGFYERNRKSYAPGLVEWAPEHRVLMRV